MKINYANMSNNYVFLNHIYRMPQDSATKINLLRVMRLLDLIKNLRVMIFIETVQCTFMQTGYPFSISLYIEKIINKDRTNTNTSWLAE